MLTSDPPNWVTGTKRVRASAIFVCKRCTGSLFRSLNQYPLMVHALRGLKTVFVTVRERERRGCIWMCTGFLALWENYRILSPDVMRIHVSSPWFLQLPIFLPKVHGSQTLISTLCVTDWSCKIGKRERRALITLRSLCDWALTFARRKIDQHAWSFYFTPSVVTSFNWNLSF